MLHRPRCTPPTATCQARNPFLPHTLQRSPQRQEAPSLKSRPHRKRSNTAGTCTVYWWPCALEKKVSGYGPPNGSASSTPFPAWPCSDGPIPAWHRPAERRPPRIRPARRSLAGRSPADRVPPRGHSGARSAGRSRVSNEGAVQQEGAVQLGAARHAPSKGAVTAQCPADGRGAERRGNRRRPWPGRPWAGRGGHARTGPKPAIRQPAVPHPGVPHPAVPRPEVSRRSDGYRVDRLSQS